MYTYIHTYMHKTVGPDDRHGQEAMHHPPRPPQSPLRGFGFQGRRSFVGRHGSHTCRHRAAKFRIVAAKPKHTAGFPSCQCSAFPTGLGAGAPHQSEHSHAASNHRSRPAFDTSSRSWCRPTRPCRFRRVLANSSCNSPLYTTCFNPKTSSCIAPHPSAVCPLSETSGYSKKEVQAVPPRVR